MSEDPKYLEFKVSMVDGKHVIKFLMTDSIKKQHAKHLYIQGELNNLPKSYGYSFKDNKVQPFLSGEDPFIIHIPNMNTVDCYSLTKIEDQENVATEDEGEGDGHICGCPQCRPC